MAISPPPCLLAEGGGKRKGIGQGFTASLQINTPGWRRQNHRQEREKEERRVQMVGGDEWTDDLNNKR